MVMPLKNAKGEYIGIPEELYTDDQLIYVQEDEMKGGNK